MSAIKFFFFIQLVVLFVTLFAGSAIYAQLKTSEASPPVVIDRLVYPDSMSCPIETRPEREHFILLCIDNAPETLEAMRLCISTAKADYCDVDKIEL